MPIADDRRENTCPVRGARFLRAAAGARRAATHDPRHTRCPLPSRHRGAALQTVLSYLPPTGPTPVPARMFDYVEEGASRIYDRWMRTQDLDKVLGANNCGITETPTHGARPPFRPARAGGRAGRIPPLHCIRSSIDDGVAARSALDARGIDPTVAHTPNSRLISFQVVYTVQFHLLCGRYVCHAIW